MKKTALICLVAMVALVGLSTQAQGQLYFRNMGTLGAGSVSLDIPFDTGSEWYAFAGVLPVDVTTGSGHGMLIDTMSESFEADTELACYGASGYVLIAANDDGPVNLDIIITRAIHFIFFLDQCGFVGNVCGY